jgi:putative transposase
MRLDEFVYREPGRTFSVTVGTAPRFPFFADVALGLECVSLLKRICADTMARGYAYCLMPDHVHLLIGVGNRRSIGAIVGGWKSLCYQARRRRGYAERFWQRSFYDHALRREEDVRVVARYILENPVRAGLVRDSFEYPLSGSFEFNAV